MHMNTFIRFTVVVFLALTLWGCATARYEPVETSVERMDVHKARQELFPALIRHLATQRGYPFANLYFKGEYLFAGIKVAEDQSSYLFLLQAKPTHPADWKHLPLAPYVYIMFTFLDDPHIIMEKNTIPFADHTDDGDGPFQGIFKLTMLNAQYCSGETKRVPVTEGNTLKVFPQGKSIGKSWREKQRMYYTPTYCQGITVPDEYPTMAGVRFYFDAQEDMESFASLLAGAFPRVRLP
jgi:hypothetical protein